MSSLPFSAVLLAAGRSTRMGTDKALLPAPAGGPLWQRQRDVLAKAGAVEIFLSVRPDQAWARPAEGFSARLYDAQPDCGPLIGLTAGLERAVHPHLAVLAIDLPRLDAEWFALLRAECAPGIGAVGRRDGRFEPLAAIYPREIMPRAWERIARAEYALQPLLAEAEAAGLLQVREISPDEADGFENWNGPP